MTEGADVPPKKKAHPEAVPEPKPGTATNVSDDPVWVLGQTVQPGESIDVPDVNAMPADIWETK